MKLVIQRVKEASVTVDNETIGKIGKGFMVLVGIGADDTEQIADRYIEKMVKMRIFEDSEGKTNLSLADVDGEILMISQFTLYANCRKGNRPSFIDAGGPEMAESPPARGRDRNSGRTGRSRSAAGGPEMAGGLCGRGTNSRRKSPNRKAWRRGGLPCG